MTPALAALPIRHARRAEAGPPMAAMTILPRAGRLVTLTSAVPGLAVFGSLIALALALALAGAGG